MTSSIIVVQQVPQHLGLRVALRERLAHRAVVERGLAALEAPRRGLADGGRDAVAAQPLGHLEDDDRAFGGERSLRDRPTVVLGADPLLDGHDDLVEEELVEVATRRSPA